MLPCLVGTKILHVCLTINCSVLNMEKKRKEKANTGPQDNMPTTYSHKQRRGIGRQGRSMEARDQALKKGARLVDQNAAWAGAILVRETVAAADLDGKETQRVRPMTFRITDNESFEVAKGYENPLVLVFASNYKPGGSFMKGITHTQEENLCCRSTLYQALHGQIEPLPVARRFGVRPTRTRIC